MAYRKMTITGTSNQIDVTPSSGTFTFGISPNVQVSSISFDSGTNVLQDYVQINTFVPTADGLSSTGTLTYTTQIGYYARIGYMLHFDLVVGWSAIGTATGQLVIKGLPFSAKDLGDAHAQLCACATDGVAFDATYVRTVAACDQGASTITVYEDATTKATVALAIPSSGTFYISGSYIITGA